MKKAYLPPLAVLAVILAFAVWNSLSMSEDTSRWRDQLQCADAQAQAGNWPAATAELVDSYKDWSAHQTYLQPCTAGPWPLPQPGNPMSSGLSCQTCGISCGWLPNGSALP